MPEIHIYNFLLLKEQNKIVVLFFILVLLVLLLDFGQHQHFIASSAHLDLQED